MHLTTLASSLALLSATGWAQYSLVDDYMSGNFFDEFSFWDTADPTNGFVSYQSQSSCEAQHLIAGGNGGPASFGVNNQTVTPNGRESVRLTSNKSYQTGLFIIDVAHMPGGICGTWPAFWMVGPDWPNGGEIDIIEGVNDQQANDMTLHTGPGCTLGGGNTGNSLSAFSGSVVSTNCVSSGGDNQGCQIASQNTATFGTEFNQNGGGVYATEWTSEYIAMYWFPRNNIPSDVLGSSPDPSGWGQPLALFSGGGCDYGSAFTNQQIVFDTTFCGDWAGQVWSGSTCAASTGEATCNDFVANHPEAFDDAYWTVNSLKVYSNNGGSSPPPSNTSASPSQSSPTGWGGAPSGSPTGIPEISGTPGWPAPSGAAPSSPQSAAPSSPASPPASAPPPPPSAAPPAPTGQPISEVSGRPQWGAQPSHTWGGHSPWHSGSVNENENSDGSWSAGTPAGGNNNVVSVVKVVTTTVESTVYETVVARHLGRHRRRHGGGRL